MTPDDFPSVLRVSCLPNITSLADGSSQQQVEIITGKLGYLTARVIDENREKVYLHSLYDPMREAESHVPAIVEHDTLVFLGTGLGYHVNLTLRATPHVKRVILVERFPELAAAAAAGIKDIQLSLDIITSVSEQNAIPADLDSSTLKIIIHPPSLNANPRWYAVYHALMASAGRRKRELGCNSRTLTILFLFGAYYGQRECIRGFQALGHNVVVVDYRRNDSETIAAVQKSLVDEQPDLVFSVNMRGLDKHGVVGEMLRRTGTPLAVWFVDSPEFIFSEENMPHQSIATVFLWDRSYIPQVRRRGYRTFFLPLAADPLLGESAHSVVRFRSRISFVGNSLVGDFLSRLTLKFPASDVIQALTLQAVSAILENRGTHLAVLDKLIEESSVAFPDQESLLFFRAHAVHSATTQYRTMLLERLIPHELIFFGDPPGWQAIFGKGITALPDVNYFSETPMVYASSEINFNATSLQMPETVNQRVFDVPLCGGFLLTDRQAALEELFDDDEKAVYEGVEDVEEKALYYLVRPALRSKIAAKARARVLSEHTYEHRMGELLRLLGM